MSKSNNTLEVRKVEPFEMLRGMQDCISYACERFDVESTSELNDDEWSHAVSEYITSLTFNIKDFRKFIKRIK